jgi:squalene synthase HpnC
MKSNLPKPGKTSTQENFPVASRLIHARHRPVILAFYRFARTADDVADDPALTATQKIIRLDRMERSLFADDADGAEPHAASLGRFQRERGISPRHAQDLLAAFRLDAVKRRYADWDDLMSYCARSAMPVGRFVLDVHGESRATWRASDAICAALQIINHLQDCGQDFRVLDRVYLPMDLMVAHGVSPDALGADVASAGLRRCIGAIATNVADLLHKGQGLADEIVDRRLRFEIAVIHALAVRLTRRLTARDPLSEETHLSGLEAMGTSCHAILQQATHMTSDWVGHKLNPGL